MNKKLGFGLMRLPLLNHNDDGSIDIEQAKKMVDIFIERGFTYFDTAWMYHDFKSENAVKEILTSRYPRDSYTLTTKLHSGFFNSVEERDKVFESQLEKTGAGYFDYYWLHDINAHSLEKYEELGCFDFIRDLKKQGRIKHYGFSFHDNADFLDKVLTKYPDMEYVQLQINYLDWENSAIESRKCYEVATKHGKPVIVMEPVKGGTLAAVPDKVEKMFKEYNPDASIPSWAVRYAASLPNVFVVLSGMSSIAQMEDNTSYMVDFEPVNEEEKTIIEKAADIINASIEIPCTGCEYCVPGCPMNIAIPRYFSLYNTDLMESEEKTWNIEHEYYVNLTKEHGKASDCIACGQCEGMCPQHLPIIENLKKVAEYFEIEE